VAISKKKGGLKKMGLGGLGKPKLDAAPAAEAPPAIPMDNQLFALGAMEGREVPPPPKENREEEKVEFQAFSSPPLQEEN